MRSTVAAAFFPFILVLCVSSSAQQSSTTPQATSDAKPAQEKLPSDLRIPAILKTTLSSKKSKVGDLVKLEVAADVHDGHGAVLLPRHARLTGRVTRAVRYEKNKQAALLSFVVESAEWKDHSAALDAPVYGIDIQATDSQQGEMVDGIKSGTLGQDDPLNIVDTQIQADTRVGGVGGFVGHAVRDANFHTRLMQLRRVPDAAIRSVFMKPDGDFQITSELMVVCLNDMKAAQ